jgi:hypothetical protein
MAVNSLRWVLWAVRSWLYGCNLWFLGWPWCWHRLWPGGLWPWANIAKSTHWWPGFLALGSGVFGLSSNRHASYGIVQMAVYSYGCCF